MGDRFDPYHKWLGIPPKDQPPNHYRLLGLEPFETDPDVIESAADRIMAHLRSLQVGQHSALSQQLLNEVAGARRCLLEPRRKASYDEALTSSQPQSPPTVKEPPPAPSNMVATMPVAPPAIVLIPSAIPFVHESESRATPPRPLWREPVVAGGAALGLTIGIVTVCTMIMVLARQSSTQPENVAVSIVQPMPQRQAPADTAPPAETPDELDGPAPMVSSDEPQASDNALDDNNSAADTARDVATEAEIPQAKTVSTAPLTPLNGPTPQPPNTELESPLRQPQSAGFSSPASVGTAPAGDVPRIKYDLIGAPIDVLKPIDPERDAVHGKWWFDGNELVSPAGVAWARLQLPVTTPEEYILTVEASTQGNFHTLNLGLVGGGSQFIYCSSASGKGGLFLLDGKEWHVNETSYPAIGLLQRGSNTVMCLVHKTGVIAQVNRRTVLDWEGDFQRLSLQPAWRMRSTDALFLGTWPQYRYTKVELQAIQSLR